MILLRQHNTSQLSYLGPLLVIQFSQQSLKLSVQEIVHGGPDTGFVQTDPVCFVPPSSKSTNISSFMPQMSSYDAKQCLNTFPGTDGRVIPPQVLHAL